MHRRYYLALLTIGLLVYPLLMAAQASKPDNASVTAKPSTATSETSGAKTTGKPPAANEDKKGQSSGKEATETVPAKEAPAAQTGQPTGAPPPAAQTGQPTGAPPPPAVEAEESISQTGTYTVRLRDLEDRINRLKEQIFRSKARLSLLAETVLDRKIAGSKAIIVFKNEMGGSFRLVKATFLLDGGPIFNKSDEGGNLAERDVINLYDGPVMPGEHTLSAVLNYRGHGYGIFSYLRGYSFKTRSSRTFTVNEGKAMKLEVVGYEKGGVTTPLEDRPDVRYIMNVVDYDSASKEEEGAGEGEGAGGGEKE